MFSGGSLSRRIRSRPKPLLQRRHRPEAPPVPAGSALSLRLPLLSSAPTILNSAIVHKQTLSIYIYIYILHNFSDSSLTSSYRTDHNFKTIPHPPFQVFFTASILILSMRKLQKRHLQP